MPKYNVQESFELDGVMTEVGQEVELSEVFASELGDDKVSRSEALPVEEPTNGETSTDTAPEADVPPAPAPESVPPVEAPVPPASEEPVAPEAPAPEAPVAPVEEPKPWVGNHKV